MTVKFELEQVSERTVAAIAFRVCDRHSIIGKRDHGAVCA